MQKVAAEPYEPQVFSVASLRTHIEQPLQKSKGQITRWELPEPELLVTITGISTHATRMDQVVYEAIKH
eukprot:2420552-Rhodomonas_salina.1